MAVVVFGFLVQNYKYAKITCVLLLGNGETLNKRNLLSMKYRVQKLLLITVVTLSQLLFCATLLSDQRKEFESNYCRWVNGDGDYEKIRAKFRDIATDCNHKYAKDARGLLFSHYKEDKNFVLSKLRLMQAEEVNEAAFYAANVLLKSGNSEDKESAYVFLSKLLASADDKLSFAAAAVLQDSVKEKDYDLLYSVFRSVAEKIESKDAFVVAQFLVGSKELSDNELAFSIARVELANLPDASVRAALILCKSDNEADKTKTIEAFRWFLTSFDQLDNFLAASYLFDLGEKEDKINAELAFKTIIEDLDSEYNSLVVSNVWQFGSDKMRDYVDKHVCDVMKEKKGSEYLRMQYTAI